VEHVYLSHGKGEAIATRPYERRIVKLLPPDERDRMETAVAINPEAHPIVPGTKGVRKARWSLPGVGTDADKKEIRKLIESLKRDH
jgi:hypothetical protein